MNEAAYSSKNVELRLSGKMPLLLNSESVLQAITHFSLCTQSVQNWLRATFPISNTSAPGEKRKKKKKEIHDYHLYQHAKRQI